MRTWPNPWAMPTVLHVAFQQASKRFHKGMECRLKNSAASAATALNDTPVLRKRIDLASRIHMQKNGATKNGATLGAIEAFAMLG